MDVPEDCLDLITFPDVSSVINRLRPMVKFTGTTNLEKVIIYPDGRARLAYSFVEEHAPWLAQPWWKRLCVEVTR